MSTYHGILLHVIFSTKYRTPCLAGAWQDELFEYIGVTVRQHKATLIKSGGIEDHVHLLMRFHPQYAIAETMRLLKASSSRWINDKRFLRSNFEWQRGYGAFSVSQSMVEVVKQYIAGQREHHRTKSFKVEFLEFLRKHEIEFDPRYVFDSEIIA